MVDAQGSNPMEMVSTHPLHFKDSKEIKKNMTCWGCGGSGHSWRECSSPRQGNNLPFRAKNQTQNGNDGQNLNGWQGKDPLPAMTREDQHQWRIKASWGIEWVGILQSQSMG